MVFDKSVDAENIQTQPKLHHNQVDRIDIIISWLNQSTINVKGDVFSDWIF
jgi:hypothetical protein